MGVEYRLGGGLARCRRWVCRVGRLIMVLALWLRFPETGCAGLPGGWRRCCSGLQMVRLAMRLCGDRDSRTLARSWYRCCVCIATWWWEVVAGYLDPDCLHVGVIRMWFAGSPYVLGWALCGRRDG